MSLRHITQTLAPTKKNKNIDFDMASDQIATYHTNPGTNKKNKNFGFGIDKHYISQYHTKPYNHKKKKKDSL